jgi:hypothetical protein
MARCVLLAVALLALPAPAFGAGGPVIGMDAGLSGVTARGLPDRYVAMQSLRGTTIARIERDGGRVVVARHFPRGLVIPIVAYDGTATGLSADGRALVATHALRRRSEFTVLETKRLKRRATITLRGRFTLDAVSRDGGLLYLIEAKGERYAVRAYHVGARELLPEPIVDPDEPDEPMQGAPLTRTMSRDGRWAYTLYDGGDHPFIHALDTEEASAQCIDLHELAGRDDLLAMRLAVGRDGAIAVRHVQERRPLLVVDPRSFAVRPAAVAPPAVAEDRAAWPLAVAGLAVLALMAGAARRVRRRRPAR